MRIGIDARLYNESGIGRYIRNLINLLQILDHNNEYFIFLLEKEFKNLELDPNFNKVKADFKWYGIAEQIKLPKLLNNYNLDLMHFPHFNVPIFYEQSSRFFGNGKGKFVVTIHDLIHQKFTMHRVTTLNPLTYKLKQFGYNKVFQYAIKKSRKILVPSNYVKNELTKNWNVSSEKIVVTYEGVDEIILNLIPQVNDGEIKKVLKNFKINLPYIFYVGNAHPHKNVEGLIKTFLQLRNKYQNLQLVLSGNDHYFWQRIKNEFNQKDIIYTGFVSDEQLVALYKGSKCFVMPSFEEGFGIPLLEAMACSTPVVSSNAASLKEIGQEACLYFDPKNPNDMLEKISKVLSNEKLRKELIEKGQSRYKQFSWKKLAEQTLKIYSSI